jgi:hypothetical protein
MGLVVAALVAVSGCGSSSSDQATHREKAQQIKDSVAQIQSYVARHQRNAGGGDQRLPPCRQSGRRERFHGRLLLGIPDGLGATADNLGPETNMWLMHVCDHFTAVGAGADPANRENGRFTIYRRGPRPARGTVKTVEVPAAGTLTITKAPTGHRVVARGHEPDGIEFTSKNGVTGTLRLSDDSVMQNP